MLRVIWLMSAIALVVYLSACGSTAPQQFTPANQPDSPPQPSSFLPTVSVLSPSSAVADSPDVKLTVSGKNFLGEGHKRSLVVWSVEGTETFLETTFVSSEKLTAVVPAELLRSPGQAEVFLRTGDVMGDTPLPKSNAIVFDVLAANESAVTAPSVNGNWTGRFIADMGPGHSVDAKISGPLKESSGSIQKTGLALKSAMCFSAVGVLSGTRTGNTVKMQMVAADFAGIQFTGTLSGNRLSGTFHISGSECGSGTGTMTLTRIPPVTGTWGGSLRNNSGLTAPIVFSLTQTQTIISLKPSPAPFFSISALKLTGMLREAGSGCTLQVLSQTPGFLGKIQGQSLTLKSNGTPGISFKGSVNLSSTTITGTYQFSGTSCNGQTGTFALSRQ